MLWLTVAVSAYFLFALVALVDKHLLSGRPNPKIYSFYVGLLSVLVLVLAPFVGFFIPDAWTILLSLLAGFVFIFALFGYYSALKFFEVSTIVPVIGGLTPLFAFGLIYLLPYENLFLPRWYFLSFILIVSGSVLAVFRNKKILFFSSFKISALAAFLFALSFVLAKYVYLNQPFWNGFIWMRMGSLLTAFAFLGTEEVRKEVFGRQDSFREKTGIIFLVNQGLGAAASILQNWAIALAGLIFLPIINALQGLQYIFLFLLTVFFSLRFPEILRENISKKIIVQKIVAIIFICLGLVILALK
jgi:drug/metabolite transporter (DMT)-like permease